MAKYTIPLLHACCSMLRSDSFGLSVRVRPCLSARAQWISTLSCVRAHPLASAARATLAATHRVHKRVTRIRSSAAT